MPHRLANYYIDNAWENVVSVFPNLKCLNIHCFSYQPDLLLAALGRLPKLRRFRLHTQNPLEIPSLSVEGSLLARQQVKSFCARNRFEFLWSQFKYLQKGNMEYKILPIKVKNFHLLRQIHEITQTLPHANSFDWL